MSGRRTTSIQSKRRNARVTLIILFLIAMGLFFSGRNDDSILHKSRTAAEDAGSTVLHYVTMPLRGLESFSGSIKDRFTAHTENKRLTEEVARLSDVEARANAMAIKLSRLETILNVDSASDIPDLKIAARAVSEINGPFVRSSLINVGRNKGVNKGDAVMTVDGLYGHVIRTGMRSARVLKLEDLNSRIAVMSKRTQSRAILTGNNSRIPVLSYTSSNADWRDGDEIITSGDDGVLPLGLPVGSVRISEDGTYFVDLFVHKNFVDWVWVYPYQAIQPPELDPAEPIPVDSEPVESSATEMPENSLGETLPDDVSESPEDTPTPDAPNTSSEGL